MNEKNKKVTELIKTIQGMTWKTVVYPILVSMFGILVIVLFILSVRFISKSINRVFSDQSDVGNSFTRLEVDKFLPVAAKLGISTSTPQKPTIESPAPESDTPVKEPTISSEIPKEKASLVIAVYNGTQTSGLAGKMKEALEEAGFTVKTSGNKTGDYPNTIIEVKESAQGAEDEIRSLVEREQYRPTIRTAPTDAPHDIVIIIGTK